MYDRKQEMRETIYHEVCHAVHMAVTTQSGDFHLALWVWPESVPGKPVYEGQVNGDANHKQSAADVIINCLVGPVGSFYFINDRFPTVDDIADELDEGDMTESGVGVNDYGKALMLLGYTDPIAVAIEIEKVDDFRAAILAAVAFVNANQADIARIAAYIESQYTDKGYLSIDGATILSMLKGGDSIE